MPSVNSKMTRDDRFCRKSRCCGSCSFRCRNETLPHQLHHPTLPQRFGVHLKVHESHDSRRSTHICYRVRLFSLGCHVVWTARWRVVGTSGLLGKDWARSRWGSPCPKDNDRTKISHAQHWYYKRSFEKRCQRYQNKVSGTKPGHCTVIYARVHLPTSEHDAKQSISLDTCTWNASSGVGRPVSLAPRQPPTHERYHRLLVCGCCMFHQNGLLGYNRENGEGTCLGHTTPNQPAKISSPIPRNISVRRSAARKWTNVRPIEQSLEVECQQKVVKVKNY